VARYLLLFLFYVFFAETSSAQTAPDSSIVAKTDSLALKGSTAIKDSLMTLQWADSVSKKPISKTDTTGGKWLFNTAIPFSTEALDWQILRRHPYFGFNAEPTNMARSDLRSFKGKELLFYLLIFLFIIFALLRLAFPKYFSDLFRLFFRTTLKQRQIREQLIQTPLPSLLLNGFFIAGGALYASFLFQYYKLNPTENFWPMVLYSGLGLSAIYLLKFVGLKASGWLFNMKEVTDSYIFIVFIVNKMIGILLLPFLVLLAFSQGNVYTVALTLSWCIIGGLLIYRFILTYLAVRNQVKVNPFHFFIYLCAFEIAPLLLIYKGLLLFFRITA
jgi:hypothetical protein